MSSSFSVLISPFSLYLICDLRCIHVGIVKALCYQNELKIVEVGKHDVIVEICSIAVFRCFSVTKSLNTVRKSKTRLEPFRKVVHALASNFPVLAVWIVHMCPRHYHQHPVFAHSSNQMRSLKQWRTC